MWISKLFFTALHRIREYNSVRLPSLKSSLFPSGSGNRFLSCVTSRNSLQRHVLQTALVSSSLCWALERTASLAVRAAPPPAHVCRVRPTDAQARRVGLCHPLCRRRQARHFSFAVFALFSVIMLGKAGWTRGRWWCLRYFLLSVGAQRLQ